MGAEITALSQCLPSSFTAARRESGESGGVLDLAPQGHGHSRVRPKTTTPRALPPQPALPDRGKGRGHRRVGSSVSAPALRLGGVAACHSTPLRKLHSSVATGGRVSVAQRRGAGQWRAGQHGGAARQSRALGTFWKGLLDVVTSKTECYSVFILPGMDPTRVYDHLLGSPGDR